MLPQRPPHGPGARHDTGPCWSLLKAEFCGRCSNARGSRWRRTSGELGRGGERTLQTAKPALLAIVSVTNFCQSLKNGIPNYASIWPKWPHWPGTRRRGGRRKLKEWPRKSCLRAGRRAEVAGWKVAGWQWT